MVLTDYLMPGMDGETLGKIIAGTPAFNNPKIIMLTGSASKGDAKRFQEIGFSAYLVKPISQSTLFDTIVALHTKSNSSGLVTKYSLKETVNRHQDIKESVSARRSDNTGLRILLVEDHLINQKVATIMLERLNMKVDVASNGKEALQMSALIAYDLILMDCQMPEMDGFEATAKIRQRENGKMRIPIIALTANALKTDQDKCLSAGMDDYLSKPLDIKLLEEMLTKWSKTLPEKKANSLSL